MRVPYCTPVPLLLVLLVHAVIGSYVVTTPRKWMAGSKAQVCMSVEGGAAGDEVRLTVKTKSQSPPRGSVGWWRPPPPRNREEPVVVISDKVLKPHAGSPMTCDQISVPATQHGYGELHLTGSLGGSEINVTKEITFSTSVGRTFIQTDKFLYKASQKVQFRVLTLGGPFLKVSTESYPEIYVETPSGSRIAQWLNVSNEGGLIHLDMQLISEPEEGTYTIKVISPITGLAVTKNFKIEDYVLPRFEVTINPPKYILADAEEIKFEVCVMYTFGQPVRGNASVTLTNNGYGRNRVDSTTDHQIFGCKEIIVIMENLKVNTPGYHVYNVGMKVNFEEEGTGQTADASDSVSVTRTALTFTDMETDSYRKPELPYTKVIKVSFPDGSPAFSELFSVCVGDSCRNITSDGSGVVRYIVPPHLHTTADPELTSWGYPERVDSDHRPYMYRSYYNSVIQSYYSPTNSSLLINPESTNLKCKTGEMINLQLPVLFAAVNMTEAVLYVQVVSRGQIQYWNSQTIKLAESDLALDPATLVEPMNPPVSSYTIRGTINLPIELPTTVSPSVRIVVWYNRDDGEVVSDAREVKISKCLENKVGLTWPVERVEQGSTLPLTLTAEPNSLCSLGIVDKSVELLSSGKDTLDLESVFRILEDANISPNENSQIDDNQYCKDKVPEPTPRPLPVQPALPPRLQPAMPPGLQPAMPPGLQPAMPPRLQPAMLPAPPMLPFAPENPIQEELIDESGNILPERTEEPSVGAEVAAYDVPEDSPAYYDVDDAVPPPEKLREKRSFLPHYRYSSPHVDALKMFDESGLYIISDLTYETRPCEGRPDYPEIAIAAFSFSRPMRPRPQAVPAAPRPPGAVTEQTQNTRTYFPETWLWQLQLTSDTGEYTQQLTLPDTITEWVGKAVCVHPSKGLGLSPKTSITTFTPFFVDLTILPTVKKGEIMPVIISVFNYLHESLPVRVTLEASPEFDILDEAGDLAPAVQETAGVRSGCIPSQDKNTFTVRVRPSVVGSVNLTVIAVVDPEYPEQCGPEVVISKVDKIIKPITVEYEGFPREKTWTKYMCSEDLNENLDFFEEWPLAAPEGIVPESERAWVTAVGDLLGPTLENLGNLIKMPYGCGEQNMLNFAPNIYVLQYLEASKQSKASVKDKAVDFMKSGYQRELNYKHRNGAYSAFGESDDSGSTWLTAFVVKSFAQARQYIDVDATELTMSSDWLKMRQMENGCFESVGKVLHKGMKGGLDGGDKPKVLSAYVMAALLEAGEDPAGEVISNAVFCLSTADVENTGAVDPYELAVKAYALSLAKMPETKAVIYELLAAAESTSSSLYWQLPNSKGSQSKTTAVAVETAGYVLMALMETDPEVYRGESHRLVKWISKQRNSLGGFISTQDTVVALQALALYERHQNQEPLDLMVSVHGIDVSATFKITETNKLLMQRAEVPVVPNNIILDMVGTGCSLLQGVVRYNVKDSEPSEAFSIGVSTSTDYDSSNCNTWKVKVCASYLLNDGASNMAVIEVTLVSGYIPEKKDLKKIVGYGTGIIKRYEVDGSKVLFYVDQFTSRETCVEFRIIEDMKVENAKPGTVKVYDYYEPEFVVSETYKLGRVFCPSPVRQPVELPPFEDIIVNVQPPGCGVVGCDVIVNGQPPGCGVAGCDVIVNGQPPGCGVAGCDVIVDAQPQEVIIGKTEAGDAAGKIAGDKAMDDLFAALDELPLP